MVKRSTLPRSMAAGNPAAHGRCLKCGENHATGSGVLLASGYTYAMFEQATALVWLGRGGTLGNVAVGMRIEADRTRQASRPTCMGRAWLPRDVYVKQARTTTWKDYDYRSPRARKTFGGTFSRSATTVASYLDVFGPAIVAAYAPTEMPRVLALDSKPFQRRAWAADKAGAVSSVPGGERNGEAMVVADHTVTTAAAIPIITALEGGKDSESWMRVLRRLPDWDGPGPFWVVADLDLGIKLAIETLWPNAIQYRCEEHLRARMRKALVADGIPVKVTPILAAKLGVTVVPREPVKAVRRGTLDSRVHPLHTLVNRSLMSRADWETMKVGIEGIVPKTKKKRLLPVAKTALRTWITDNEAMVLAQFDLKDRYPDMPRSAGGVEGTLSRLGTAIGKRGEYFSNARRLELIAGLVRIESLGLANVDRYSQIIAESIAARGGVGMDWQEGRDLLGSSSLDDLIDFASDTAVIAEADRADKKRMADKADKTALADIERAAVGLPPMATGRFLRPNGPMAYHPIKKGQMVSDTPEISRFWRPEYNDGKLASQVGAGHGKYATWVCDEHEGHLHVWPRRVMDMSITRSGCPFCARRRPCPATSLAGRNPTLAKEWASSNGPMTPETVLDGSSKYAMWTCPKKGHPDFRQRINSRTRDHQGCPACANDKIRARRRGTMTAAKIKEQAADAARKAAGRTTRAASRPPKFPPVMTHPAFDLTEPSLSRQEAADAMGRSLNTIANWILAGRLGSIRLGNATNAKRRIPLSEVERVGALLQIPLRGPIAPSASGPVAHAGNADNADPAAPFGPADEADDDEDSSIDWKVPPGERITDEPVTW